MKRVIYGVAIIVAFVLVGCGNGGSATSKSRSNDGSVMTKNTTYLNDLPPVPQIPAEN